MKITKEQLNMLIKEELKNAIVPDGKKVVALQKDFDSFIEETIERAKKLADDGEEIIRTNVLTSPDIAARNEIVLTKVGMLRAIANNLASNYERMRRRS